MRTVCLLEGRAFVGTYRSLRKVDRALRMKDEDEKLRECCGASLRRWHSWGRNGRSRIGSWSMKGWRKEDDGTCFIISNDFVILRRLARHWLASFWALVRMYRKQEWRKRSHDEEKRLNHTHKSWCFIWMEFSLVEACFITYGPTWYEGPKK